MMFMRKESIDSNNSSRTLSGAGGTFVVPNSSCNKSPRIVDPLSNLFATGSAGASKVTSGVQSTLNAGMAKEPVVLRQMVRRFSICGAGGPIATSASPAAASAAGSSSTNNVGFENLKRRLVNSSQSAVPPQQRVRYSHSPQLQTIAPGNSLLVRHAAPVGQKQHSPTGGIIVAQKAPQSSGIQGGSFTAFATPNSGRGNNPSGSSMSTTPLKRGMVIANVKGSSQQKSSVSAIRSAQQTGLSLLQSKSASSPNVANLLADSRPQNQTQTASKTPTPTPTLSVSQSQSQPSSSAADVEREETEMAGVIAADYFDMSRLKREPQDSMDDDILGI